MQTVLAILLSFVIAAADAQQAGYEIFSATDEILQNARAIDAASLSPDNFARGMSEYDKSRSTYEKTRDAVKVESSLAKARDYFRQSIAHSETATSVLADIIDSRTAAENADAGRLAPEAWADGEKQFKNAVRALEKGDSDVAGQYGAQADELFRTAELEAFRTQFFSEARRLIGEAEIIKAGKFAPRTLGRAKVLLAEADAALTENRYQAERPTALADQASYEARHAIHIAGLASEVRSGTLSVEDIVLDWEMPLTELAGILDIEPDMAGGYTGTAGKITGSVRQLLTLNDELSERDRLIAGLEEELRELDARLGGASTERIALVKRLEHQNRVREQFALVSTMFAPDEAAVFRDQDQLIVRLVGLSFASNSSTIDPESTDLMKKVENAINIFPRCQLTIEGHTDSQGNAQRNLELSVARAQSVMTFLNEEMRIPDYRMKSAGYGDSRPISSNKTEAGRAKNRRIDLIIVPDVDDLAP
jgi:OOP family OmpA-OmpF porin